jgi:flagellar biogenesis protein FliO
VNNPLNRLPIDPRLKKVLPYIFSVVLLVAVLIGAFISAENNNPPVASTPADGLALVPPSSSFDITLDVVLKIIFVFGLIYLFFALLRWWQKKQPGLVQNRLRIVETVRPAPRQTFYLLKVGSQEFLVGATDQSMSLISEIEPEAWQEEPSPNKAPEESTGISGFNSLLQQTMKQTKNLFQKNTIEENINGSPQQVIK